MLTTLKTPSVTKWTWSGTGFVRESPSEKQLTAPNRRQVYKRARYYDTNTGEFISRDPLEYVDGMSLYRGYFVPNSIDPTGFYRDPTKKKPQSPKLKECIKRCREKFPKPKPLPPTFGYPNGEEREDWDFIKCRAGCLVDNALDELDKLPDEPHLCGCQEKFDECQDWADAGQTNCIARSVPICGTMCGIRFVGQPVAIAKCMGACETSLVWACTRDWRNRRSCCRKAKKNCEANGEWKYPCWN